MNVIETTSRQHFADELRGLALLGIVLVNVPFLGISMMGFSHTMQTPWWDRLAQFLVVAFFQGKFYLLFSFLFGYSAHLILGKGNRSRQFMLRLIALAILGSLHALLFFVGDILVSYALLGTVLLFAWRCSDATLIKASKVAAAIAVGWICFLGWLITLPSLSGDTDLSAIERFDESQRSGSFWQAVQSRFEIWPDALVVLGSLNWAFALSCFFLGMLASRKKVFANPQAYSPIWKKCRQLGWIGLPLNLFAAWLVAGPGAAGDTGGLGVDTRTITGIFLGFCAAPFLSAAYVGWMIHIREIKVNAFAMFRSAGRMSMTLYIGESILLAAFFGAWGAGFFGQFGAAATLGIATIAWAALEIFAKFWLSRFEQGPLEYLMKKWCSLAA
jgi:uncharacterized protein